MAGSEHPKARPQEAQFLQSSTMTKTEERETETNDSDRRVRQTVGSLRQHQKSATTQEHALQVETIDFFVTVTRKGVA